MNEQPSYDEKHSLYYSYNLEAMSATLYRRVNDLSSFILIILGSAIAAGILNVFFLGVAVTVISAYQFIYRPGEAAAKASAQALKYERLIHELHFHGMTSEQLSGAIRNLIENDTPTLGSFRNPAHIRAHIALGMTRDNAIMEKRKLNLCERFLSFIVGGIPM
ncbi:hypothetical protein Z042_01450 [Chania multitudinisentens RB-25]|uniref:SMODS and SLOG-associating 2TM effector domain-containing protein n=1 Tax=Chania multitudinisentens RB-25 TaxID=1441930 RepID=W0LFC9_9GAMM|nr:hypothetical protein [Chania multitudinisentens]AHG22573.1 hypothetical protein Z042_01450 [Chania multitudinisentens RB-25]